MLDSYTLFVKGIKPALLLDDRSKGFTSLTKRYPYIEFVYGNRLFFLREEQKIQFLKVGLLEGINDLVYKDDEMGYALGFPPIAVRDFMEEIPEHDRINVEYHGISFVVHRNHVLQALNELETIINIPLSIINEYQSLVSLFHIPVSGKGFVEMSEEEIQRFFPKNV